VKVGVRIRDYDQLVGALAARRRALGLRQLEVDQRAGLQSAYCGKLEIKTRKLGPLSLPMLLAALDADLLLVPRSEAVPLEPRSLGARDAGSFDRRALPPTGEC
jgi:hypothetical protein